MRLIPTLCWFSASDGFLHQLCASGTALSVLLIVGIASKLVLLLLWMTYMSIVVVGNAFLSFQWDSLLLETAFLLILLAPAGFWPRRWCQPSATHSRRWLLWWLLFKLMFLPGATKLLSGDGAWHSLTALDVHYETQPLPT